MHFCSNVILLAFRRFMNLKRGILELNPYHLCLKTDTYINVDIKSMNL